MKRIILISGYAQNGKDTSAGFMKEFLEARGERVQIMHYADDLKYICKQYFGWDGNKDEAGRQLLQQVGTNIVREKFPNFWVERLYGTIRAFWDLWDCVIIPDTRFPNEVMGMMRYAGTYYIRVNRPNFESPLTEEQKNHPSETALDNFPSDFVIENAGTLDDLRASTQEVLRRIINGK